MAGNATSDHQMVSRNYMYCFWGCRQVCAEAEACVRNQGSAVLVLSHRAACDRRVPINSLLAVGAVHHHLIQARGGARGVREGSCWEGVSNGVVCYRAE